MCIGCYYAPPNTGRGGTVLQLSFRPSVIIRDVQTFFSKSGNRIVETACSVVIVLHCIMCRVADL